MCLPQQLVFLDDLALWGLVVALVAGWMCIGLLCLVVEMLAGLVGRVSVALFLVKTGSVLKIAAVVLCRWLAVESYISQ